MKSFFRAKCACNMQKVGDAKKMWWNFVSVEIFSFVDFCLPRPTNSRITSKTSRSNIPHD